MATSWRPVWPGVGKQVTLVTPLDTVAPFGAFTNEDTETIRRLRELNVETVVAHLLHELDGSRAIGGAVDDPAEARTVEWPTDALVLVTQRLPQDHLYREMRRQRSEAEKSGIAGIFRIGDCVSPRLIADCVFDGHRLGREIDTDDPATPLPFIRENRVLGPGDEDYPSRLASLRALRALPSVDA
jgi:dimethylamine/trimethylamine dehydrogenase